MYRFGLYHLSIFLSHKSCFSYKHLLIKIWYSFLISFLFVCVEFLHVEIIKDWKFLFNHSFADVCLHQSLRRNSQIDSFNCKTFQSGCPKKPYFASTVYECNYTYIWYLAKFITQWSYNLIVVFTGNV